MFNSQLGGNLRQQLVGYRAWLLNKLYKQAGIFFFVIRMPRKPVYFNGHFGIKFPSQFFNRCVSTFCKFRIFMNIFSMNQVSDNLHVARSVICSHKLKKFKLENIYLSLELLTQKYY